MTTPNPPGPDEPVLDSFVAEEPPAVPEPGEPVLDSFAAEEPAAPADAATGASTPTVDLPVLDAQHDAVVAPADEPAVAPEVAPVAAEEPVEPEPALPPVPAHPRGSEGLTTAPPRTSAAEPPPAHDAPVADPEPEAAPPQPTDQDAPASASGSPPAAPAGRGRAWLPLTAVGLAVALLAGATGWLAWQLRQQDRADQASVDAVAAARDAARLLFSYDHKTLQADFDKGLAVTTGDFRTQYQRTTKDVVSRVATQYKAVVQAEVVEAAVIDAQPDEVTALVFLNQATTSTRVQGQQVDQSRVRMRLVPRDGRWLVEEVKAL